MFMETLKKVVITLVTVLVFISAVELIAPNKMKKYVKFILGLILITAILNPILQLMSNGEKNILDGVKNYEEVFSKNDSKTGLDNNINISKSDQDKGEGRKKAFINNFNKNCDSLLTNKFKDMKFKSEIDCDVDFTNITLNVKKLRIGVSDNNVNKVKKVIINPSGKSESGQENNKEYTEILDYASSELNIPKEKIEIYKLEE